VQLINEVSAVNGKHGFTSTTRLSFDLAIEKIIGIRPKGKVVESLRAL
jgi:hypothetical protein